MTADDLERVIAAPGFDVPEELAEKRLRMLYAHIRDRGVADRRVLAAIASVPRHEFVPPPSRVHAYDDAPLAIGSGQTISQPYIVAYMTQALGVVPGMRVLEIGTGSGYQTAVLAALGAEVFTIERHEDLSRVAEAALDRIGHGENVTLRVDDGTLGWPEEAPFDRVLATAAGPDIPSALLEQLADGGVLVMPVGPLRGPQALVKAVRKDREIVRTELLDVVFVPLIGEQGHGGKQKS